MAVRQLPSNEVHRGIKGGKTGCGFDTGHHPPHWRASSQEVTCLKVGCIQHEPGVPGQVAGQ